MQACGVVEADTYAKRMPPQLTSGRWGEDRGQRGATEWISIGRTATTTEQRASERARPTHRQLHVKQFFSNVQSATHLGVVSLSLSRNVRRLWWLRHCEIIGRASYMRLARSPAQWQRSRGRTSSALAVLMVRDIQLRRMESKRPPWKLR